MVSELAARHVVRIHYQRPRTHSERMRRELPAPEAISLHFHFQVYLRVSTGSNARKSLDTSTPFPSRGRVDRSIAFDVRTTFRGISRRDMGKLPGKATIPA